MHQQDKWVINQLKTAGLDAVIFGTSIREAYFSQEVDETSIYLYCPSLDDPRMSAPSIITMLEMGKNQNTDFIREENLTFEVEYGEDSPIVRLISLEKDERFYEIFMGTVIPQAFIRDWITIGLNKCYYDGKKTHYTTEFMRDFHNNTITITNGQHANHLWAAITYHIPEIMVVHPGFTVNIDVNQILSSQ